ncbi:hypothetical protein [Stutzerimonas kunmingensis]|uniref:hypothetical protein n=1 Tax=Stutzerimonas kunmingensis TaxID=1211807 RepID=UPI0028A91256|nr:hypothetical protein [Stutzerimonas kunmingensis]
MSAVCWGHVLPDTLTLNKYSDDEVEAIERTAECEAQTMAHGIAAIGELLAYTADSGELDKGTATNIGWLINSLGTLSGRLVDVASAAEYELGRRKAGQPKTAEG